MRPPFSLLLAWRDGRRELSRHVLHVLALSVGVAAMVALTSLRADVEDGIRGEGRALLGADVRLSSSTPFSGAVDAVVDSLRVEGVETASSITFGTLVSVPGAEVSRFLQVLSPSAAYPLYGNPFTTPPERWRSLEAGSAFVDPEVLDQLGIEIGDDLVVGGRAVRVVATVQGLPVETGFRSALGAGLYLAGDDVEAAGLLETGSVGQWRLDLRLPEELDEQGVAEQLRARLLAEPVGITSATERAEGLIEGLGFFSAFLGLLGFTALVLGAIGVASSSFAHLESKIRTAGILRSLGARQATVFRGFLLQAAGLALLGSGIGVAGGLLLQWRGGELLEPLLGLNLVWELRWGSLLAGFAVGVWFALLSAAVPLAGLRGVAPSGVLRRFEEGSPGEGGAGHARAIPAALAAGSVLLGAIWAAPSVQAGLWYASGFAVTCACLLGTARLLVGSVRRLLPVAAPFPVRHGLASLFRPSNQTGTVVLAVGMGISFLAAITIVEASLAERIALEELGAGPNILLFEIRGDQRDAVSDLMAEFAPGDVQFVPIVPARMAAVSGRSVEEIGRDPDLQVPGWTLRRLYRNTYREDLGEAEELVRGEWWDAEGGDALARISIEEELSRELGISLGDTIEWDVQGVRVASRVSSVRRVDWGRFEPNFFVVFEPGFLEEAPQTYLVGARVEAPADRAALQNRVARSLPGVAVLDFTRIREVVEGVLARVGQGARGLLLVTLLAGALVLAGVSSAMRGRKLRDAALLRALGAKRAVVLASFASEQILLALVTVTAGLLMGTFSAAVLLQVHLDLPVAIPLGRLAALGTVGSLVVVGLGVAGAGGLFSHPPLALLRRLRS